MSVQFTTTPPARSVTRRSFLQMSGIAGGLAILAGCLPAEAPTLTDDAVAPDDEIITISWWNQFSTPTTQVVMPQIIEAFEELYPHVRVEYEITGGPPGGGEYTEILLARIAAGNPPNTATTWDPPAQFAARGSLSQLEAFMENAEYATHDAFFEGPLNSCRWRGGVYGLPASAGAGSLFYNVEMFEEAGLPTARDAFPTTWDALKDLSAQLTDWADGDPQRVGLVPWSTPWLKPVWSGLNGSRLFDADNLQYTIDTPANIEWLHFWLTWLDEQFHGDMERLNFYGDFGTAYAPGAFNEGLCAIVQSGSWACSDAEIPFAWEIAKFPVGPSGDQSVTGYWPNWWIVPLGADHPQESFHLCEFFCTRGWEIWYTQGAMDTPAWRHFPSGVLTQQLVDQFGPDRAQEIHDFYANYLEDAIDMWNSPVENFANDTLEAAISEVLFKQNTPEEALAAAQTLIQSRLDETLQA